MHLVIVWRSVADDGTYSPGRFFAANELKTMLAYVVLTYDVKFEREGVRPANFRFGPADLPAPNATVLFKKRQDVSVSAARSAK